MKASKIAALLGLFPSLSIASCQIEFEVLEPFPPAKQYKISYYDSKLETYKVEGLANGGKVPLHLSTCPQEQYVDLTLSSLISGEEINLFQREVFL
ncbi:hypothetical protein G3R49_02060 [Shewanella sp. WXL01]|uniref:hypothetical protein n=1 Tax=Shewanella sp. WXL01 TaxID=2709721 RepID=UPI0014386D53|nr:hypothetical protein [Shewanella sp. WXL01]NKF49365.1 hypothetical protein [Shewanella sp. WXL01]